MSQLSELDRFKCISKTLKTSWTNIIKKIIEQLTEDEIVNDEIECINIQLIENAEQIYK